MLLRLDHCDVSPDSRTFFVAMSMSKPAKTLDESDVDLTQMDKPVKITSTWKVYFESKSKSKKAKKNGTSFGRNGQNIIHLDFYEEAANGNDGESLKEVLVWETRSSNGKVATSWSNVLVEANAKRQPNYARAKKSTSSVLQHGSKCHLVFHFVSPCSRFVLLRCGYMWLQTLL